MSSDSDAARREDFFALKIVVIGPNLIDFLDNEGSPWTHKTQILERSGDIEGSPWTHYNPDPIAVW